MFLLCHFKHHPGLGRTTAKMAAASLPYPAHWDSGLHAPAHIHSSARTRAWMHSLLPPPAATSTHRTGAGWIWLKNSSPPPSISLSFINIWSKRGLCSYLRDSWERCVWLVYRNFNVQSVLAKDYWILACTALAESQVARGWRRDQNSRKMWDVLTSLSFPHISKKWSVIFVWGLCCKERNWRKILFYQGVVLYVMVIFHEDNIVDFQKINLWMQYYKYSMKIYIF